MVLRSDWVPRLCGYTIDNLLGELAEKNVTRGARQALNGFARRGSETIAGAMQGLYQVASAPVRGIMSAMTTDHITTGPLGSGPQNNQNNQQNQTVPSLPQEYGGTGMSMISSFFLAAAAASMEDRKNLHLDRKHHQQQQQPQRQHKPPQHRRTPRNEGHVTDGELRRKDVWVELDKDKDADHAEAEAEAEAEFFSPLPGRSPVRPAARTPKGSSSTVTTPHVRREGPAHAEIGAEGGSPPHGTGRSLG